MEEEKSIEMLTHIIFIDEYMRLEWRIPKVITPLQLKAMNSKVNKLFNLSEVQIAEDQAQPITKISQSYIKKRKYRKYGDSHWTQELKEKLKEMYNQGMVGVPIAKALLEISGDSYFNDINVVYQQINYLKKQGIIKRRKRGQNVRQLVPQETGVGNKFGTNKSFSPDEINVMIELWNSGIKSCPEITQKLNERTGKAYTYRQVVNKIYGLKVKGLIKDDGQNEIKL
jgi:hypothetical protein